MTATTFTRNGWACRVLPSDKRHDRIQFRAQRGSCLINVELCPEEVDTFNPANYWRNG